MTLRRLLLIPSLLLAVPASAQTITQRGFVDGRVWLFPQAAVNDATRVVGDFLLREDVFVKPAPWLRLAGGVDVRAGTHDQVSAGWQPDISDRGERRPHLSIRRLTATLTRDRFTLDVGKQFIRWGKADIINPTDRFAPRDFLNVVDSEFLAVTGARAAVTTGAETFEGVWIPRFTPSRIPLLDERWTVVPPETAGFRILDAGDGAELPRGSQTGLRWSHTGAAFESSVSFYDGFNNLPNIDPRLIGQPPAIEVTRVYPAIRSYGGDAAVPLRWLTIKGEASYFTSSTPGTDEYVLYVVQLERQTGEWLLVGGYAGEVVTNQRASLTFAPDRGLTRSVVGRASYTIDPARSVVFESAVRQNGAGAYAKVEYSQARGAHWRTTVTGTLIRGDPGDFLGQYRRNSHAVLALRYSF
jgi:hypothetical protein